MQHALIDAEEDARRCAGKGAVLGATNSSSMRMQLV